MSETLIAPNPVELAKACEPLNRLERELVKGAPVTARLTHRFTAGLYTREIFMAALKLPMYAMFTTEIHKTEHQYIISQGVVDVWAQDTGWVRRFAPYHGITKPGARRALRIIKDTRWTSFHPTNKTDLKEILADLIEPHSEEQELLRAAWNEKWHVNQLMEGTP